MDEQQELRLRDARWQSMKYRDDLRHLAKRFYVRRFPESRDDGGVSDPVKRALHTVFRDD